MTPLAPRRGAVSIFVLVCLVMVTAMAGVLLRVGLAERRRMIDEERRLQAEWLAESGVARAAARLAAERGDYRGETWEIAATALAAQDAGRVAIVVEPVTGDDRHRRVNVRADYPLEPSRRARVSRSVLVEVGPSGSTGESSP